MADINPQSSVPVNNIFYYSKLEVKTIWQNSVFNFLVLQRDQVQLQQKDIDSLREELDSLKKSRIIKDKQILDKVEFWENQYKLLQDECKNISENNSELKKEIELWKGRCGDLEKKWQVAESALLHSTTEVKVCLFFY